MDILIIAATQGEIAPALAHPYRGEHRVEFLVTGVGMAATAYHLGRALAVRQPDLLLNVGVCGSFDRSRALGDVVRISRDSFAELGAEDGEAFIDGEALGFGPSIFAERVDANLPVLEKLPKVFGITVNTVHGHSPSIEQVAARLSPEVESMEGAAVFYAASQAQVQCVQVRALSNYVERRQRDNWQLKNAIVNLNDWLAEFLAALPV